MELAGSILDTSRESVSRPHEVQGDVGGLSEWGECGWEVAPLDGVTPPRISPVLCTTSTMREPSVQPFRMGAGF